MPKTEETPERMAESMRLFATADEPCLRVSGDAIATNPIYRQALSLVIVKKATR
jgi:hypothetical protein